jgi:2,3,4,5-tetrahydropyridine-2-carboxylate N-succinyltransferase
VYEGTRVAAGAVLAPGVILTRATPVHDLARQRVWRAEADRPLVVPEGAVVVPGSRPARGEYAARHGLQIQTPVIVKYRDGSTNAALDLERALR